MSAQLLERHEIHLEELTRLLLRAKWLVVCVTLVVAAATTAIAWTLPPQYQASVIVSPVTSSGGVGGRLAAASSQLGSLASLAGISLDSGDNRRAESIAVLQSEALTEKYIADNNLLPILYSDKWDAARKDWKAQDKSKIPTLWDANRIFEQRIRTVVDDRKTGLVKLTITWKDAHLAAKWANDLVAMTNGYLRDRAIKESERHLAYLNEQASITNITHIRDAIYDVIESEIKNVMTAKGTDEYALRIVDPAVAPRLKSSPKRVQWMAGGVLGGLFLSVVLVLVRATWRKVPATDRV
jgi:uncharacterized protein involved in exopolysaccharide biosynthesis